MKCPECGHTLPDYAVFCGVCGKKIKAGTPETVGRPAPARTETPAPAWTDRPAPARTETPAPAWTDRPAPARTETPAPAWTDRPAPTRTGKHAPEEESFSVQEEAVPDLRAARFPEKEEETAFEFDSNKSADGDAGRNDDFREGISKAKMPDHLRRISAADKSGRGLEKFYIADFLMRLFGVKENLPLCLYLVMNIFLIGLIATMFTGGNVIVGMLAGLILYILSMTIALSPWGERLLRSRTGFVPIDDPETAARIMPIFDEVKARAKKVNPYMPDDISLFINDDEAPNAFATGRRTVCMTRGMLAMSDDQIRGALGHEFGHLSHRDTDRILVITIGNAFVTLFCVFMQICAFFTEGLIHIVAIFMGEDGFFVALLGSLSRVITVRSVSFFLWAWTGVGALLCMKTSRGNEYQADEFSYRLGYGRGLISVLGALGGGAKPNGLFATLAASHPPMNDRIARLEHLLAGK